MTLRAPWACDPAQSRGRIYAGSPHEIRGPRTAFQRDRDRIIHSISFRRLRHKTQVFVAPDGDHFRVRLTHSLEVAQIGRTIARALGLDEDLTEALCLAHDIGHPPFGHAGEDALETALAHAGGFDHNGHTLRVLTKLDSPYPLWPGLNLSWEMLEGLAKHNGPVLQPGWAMQEVDTIFPLDLASHASLEAQVAAVADDIAYDNHDIDDGLRAGLLDFDDLLTVPIVAESWAAVCRQFPGIPAFRLRGELIRHQIGRMVNDVIAHGKKTIAKAGVENVADVRAAGKALVGFSPAMVAAEARLKTFMYARLYHHQKQLAVAKQARHVISSLFSRYCEEVATLPESWQVDFPIREPEKSRYIADFIAGMTDRYAISRYREIIGNIDMPDNF